MDGGQAAAAVRAQEAGAGTQAGIQDLQAAQHTRVRDWGCVAAPGIRFRGAKRAARARALLRPSVVWDKDTSLDWETYIYTSFVGE